MTTAEQIKRGMALAFFASAFADAADEEGNPLRGEIMDQLPEEIDSAAIHAANTLAHDLESQNGRTLDDVWNLAIHCDDEGADRELTPELFGHYCAMQAMGHGVGLESFGNAVRDNVRVPYVEFGSHSLHRDYFKKTRVVFRVWKDGAPSVFFQVIALFPDLEENARGQCTSYMHVGQHGAADYSHVIKCTRPATPEEYAPLARELTGRGYNLDVRTRK